MVLDNKGCLKIADFGEAEVFRNPYEKTSHKSKRCCGSQPYMAPEEFTQKEFDSAPIGKYRGIKSFNSIQLFISSVLLI